jgi:hypothetical protein
MEEFLINGGLSEIEGSEIYLPLILNFRSAGARLFPLRSVKTTADPATFGQEMDLKRQLRNKIETERRRIMQSLRVGAVLRSLSRSTP